MARRKDTVFLVHRRGCLLRPAVESYLREIGVRVLGLSDSTRERETIVSRFEEYATEAYAVVLLSTPEAATARPGQVDECDPNLIFQLGYLAGRLGRRNVAALHRDGLELPPQCSEILCIPMDQIGIWKFALMRDLVVAGFRVGQELAVIGSTQSLPAATLRRRADRS